MATAAYRMESFFILLLCVHLGCLMTFSVTDFSFMEMAEDYEQFKGSTVRLLCQQQNQEKLSISRDEVTIVKDSILEGSSLKYSFNKVDSNNYSLTIRNVDENDTGRYFCAEGIALIKQLYLEILYHPMSGPSCNSSYGTLINYFDDKFQNKFSFDCTVEEGNPAVEVSLFKVGEQSERIDPRDITIAVSTGQRPRKTFMFSSYLNSSFNNSRLTCIAKQNTSPIYSETCSYGPMTLLPTFNILVSPSNITLREGDVASVTCSSNVSRVEKRWQDIPEGLVHKTLENETGIHLEILQVSAGGNQPKIIKCECTFGGRRLLAELTLYVQPRESRSVLVLVFILFAICATCFSLMFLLRKTYRRCRREDD